jgi:hypothetical protein
MINCKKCGYEVPNNLKYAIMNNICPSCGDVLFGDKDMMAINSILNDISRQEFSDEMNKVIINDIALFIFSTYVEDVSDNTPDGPLAGDQGGESDGQDGESNGQGGESNGQGLDRIRDEVRTEVMGEVDDEGEIIEESEDTKIARLKRLARESGLGNKRGISVKRVS